MRPGGLVGSIYVIGRFRVRTSRACARAACSAGASSLVVLLGFGELAVVTLCEACAAVAEAGVFAPSEHPEARRSARRQRYARAKAGA